MLHLRATPSEALIDVPRHITLTGAPSNTEQTIHATLTQGDGGRWAAQATYRASPQGTIDLTRDAPTAGAYTGVHPMGLAWSARREGPGDPFANSIAPTTIRLTCNGAEATITQHLQAPGVTRSDIREQGLVATLFTPPGPGPHPAIIILNGSGGGINEPRAALYAAKGYAALALAYFRAPGLSPYISNTPLEYFDRAIDWLRAENPHPFLALSGQSRGGELALLLAATYPTRINAVIAYVPGAVVHGAQSAADPALGRDGHAWLLDGKPIPHVWENNRTASWAPYDTMPEPKRHAHGVITALDDLEAVARARIPVERIQGPVLVLSGTDDGSWPSTRYGDMIMDALRRHPWPARHLAYEGAGHFILFPHVPTTETVRAHPVSGTLTTFGGTPEAAAAANEKSWPAVQQFLSEAVSRL